MSSTFLVALLVFAVISGVLVLGFARWNNKNRMATILQMVRELATVVGSDSELLGMDGRTVQVRKGSLRLEIPTSDLVDVFMRFKGEQRRWHLERLVGDALAAASRASDA